MSIGILTRARTEQRAMPITRTMIVIGRRSAARSSHMLTALPGFYHAGTAGKVEDRPAKRRPQPDSAKPRAAREHRRLLLALASSVRPRHRRASPAPLGSALAPASPLCVPRLILVAYSPQRCEPLREKLVPSAIVPSGPAGLDRSEPLPRAHLPIQPPFEIESRRCRIPETSRSSRPPSSNGPGRGLPCLPRICPWGPSRCHVRTPKIADRTSDSRNDPVHGPAPGLLPHARAAPPRPDCWQAAWPGEIRREVAQVKNLPELPARYLAIRECQLTRPC